MKNFIKITAIDEITKTEISVCSPYNLTTEEMQQLALQKLVYVLKKQE